MIGTVLPYVTSGLGIVLIGDFNKGDIRLIQWKGKMNRRKNYLF